MTERTSDTAQLTELVLQSAEQSPRPTGWYPPSVSSGQAGAALLHLYAASAGLGNLDAAFHHLREAVAATSVEPLSGPGLFAGTSGLALTVAECVRLEPRFRPSLDRLHEQLANQVLDTDYPRVERAVSDVDYDLITGAAGTLAYLSSVEKPTDRVRGAAERLLDYLIWLTGPAQTPATPHRWLLTPDVYPPLPSYREKWPHGYLNLGLSHGMPGVAAALAVAWRAGLRRPGHRGAIDALATWIVAQSHTDEHGPVWSDGTGVSPEGVELPASCTGDQLAWCYGTAGVAGALLTVAVSLGDDSLRKVAVEAFEAVLERTARTRPLSPTLCHGQAGLLMLCLELAPWSGAARAALPRLTEELLEHADPQRPLLFADQDEPGVLVDDPTLLTGASGVALTLIAALSAERPGWFRLFLAR
ncbi:lanthionine synthetase C family protein [Streptomyces sp. 549]|uniref:lanthionine synthetase C family protein n=1 Tax=Streptomyces sp. 549 TaxID=3049076 RepID=UPI0024C21C7D|nr:lanthionine synthetase C family protein [Streptomyces sp. 549]MDK1473100.1 lanthionine synthetase C family protein [Streptomyces sp. 549]